MANTPKERVLSGIQPTHESFHLGNYLGAIKQWQFHDDFVLSSLSKMVINRNLLKIELTEDKVNKIKLLELKEKYIKLYNIYIYI